MTTNNHVSIIKAYDLNILGYAFTEGPESQHSLKHILKGFPLEQFSSSGYLFICIKVLNDLEQKRKGEKGCFVCLF